MPIFYNFHILLATFYTIFGTNILIQCPVPVPVCCMFFVSQNVHIKRSPNGIKSKEIFLEYIWFLGRKIHARRCPREARGRGCAPDPRGPPVRRLMPFYGRKKANFWKKNHGEGFNPIGVTDLHMYTKRWKGSTGRTQKQRETERQIQSRRGSRPSHAMEAKDQRGNPSPI